MKKQILFILCMLSSSPSFSAREEHKVKLTSPIIEMLDGKLFGITERIIGLMLQVRSEIRKMVYGVPVKDGEAVGMYKFQGGRYSVASLVSFEVDLHTKFSALLNNPQVYSPTQAMTLRNTYEQQKAELRVLLVAIKEEFKRTTKSYLEGARGFKEQMLILISESCALRGKKSCFLLRWSEAEEGRETELLDRDIDNFKDLAVFFIDLVHFLEDLVNSCDKARGQFMAKAQAHKAAHK
jgi:hypothetical protein